MCLAAAPTLKRPPPEAAPGALVEVATARTGTAAEAAEGRPEPPPGRPPATPAPPVTEEPEDRRREACSWAISCSGVSLYTPSSSVMMVDQVSAGLGKAAAEPGRRAGWVAGAGAAAALVVAAAEGGGAGWLVGAAAASVDRRGRLLLGPLLEEVE